MTPSWKSRLEDIVVSVVAVLIGLVLIFPIIYCFCGAFKTAAEFTQPELLPGSFRNLDNFRQALTQAPLLRYMLNSCIVAFLGSSVRMVISLLAAYAFTYFDFPGRKFCFFLVLGTMMMPGDILLATNYLTVSRLHLLNSYLGICIVSFVSGSQTFMLRQKFRTVPRTLRDAAELDGCGDFRFLCQVLIPHCRPVITTLFMQSFITLWNSYLWPLLVTASSGKMRTIMVGITKLNSWEDSNYQLVMAGVVISLLPSFLLFIAMRRSVKKGALDDAWI